MSDPLPDRDLEPFLDHQSWIRELARRVADEPGGADDLEQEVWLAVLRRRDIRVDRLTSWLRGVAWRRAAERRREEAYREREERTARSGETPSSEEIVARRLLQRQVVEAVMALPPTYRRVILLRYFEDLNATEIGRRLSIPAATVRVQLKRGLDRLRKRLDSSDRDGRGLAPALALLLRVRERGRALRRPLAAAAAVFILVSVGAWLRAGDDASLTVITDSSLTAGPPVTTARARRVARAPVAGPVATPFERAAAAEHVLAGTFRVVGPGISGGESLHVEIEARVTGSDTGHREDLARLTPAHPRIVGSTRIGNGAPFALPVPEPGRYVLHIGCEGMPGRFGLLLSHEAPRHHVVRALESVTLDVAGAAGATVEVPGPPGGEPWIEATAVDDERRLVEGPVMVSLPVRVRRPGSRFRWQTSVRARYARLRLPANVVAQRFSMDDRGEPVAGAHIAVIVRDRDGRDWTSRVVTDASGSCLIPRPSGERRPDRTLIIQREGSRRALVRGLDARLARRREPAGEAVRMQWDAERPSLRLTDGQGGAAAGSVSACLPDGMILRGAADADGRCDLLALFERARMIDTGELVTTAPSAAAAVTLWVSPPAGGIACGGRVTYGDLDAGDVALEVPAMHPWPLRIADASSGQPVAGASIRVWPLQAGKPIERLAGGRPVRTDARGCADAGPVSHHRWGVSVTAPGYSPRHDVLAHRDEPTRLTLLPLSGDSASGRLEVRVVDEHGAPVPQVRLVVLDDTRRKRYCGDTGFDGAVTIDGLDPGRPLRLLDGDPGSELSLATPTLVRPRREPIEVRLLPLADVRVGLEVAGRPAAGVAALVAELERDGEGHVRAQAVRDGSRARLTAEPQLATLYLPGARARSAWIDPAPAHVEALRLTLDEGPRVRGTLGFTGESRVTLTALSIAVDARHRAALAPALERFGCSFAAEGGRLCSPPLTPGRYRIVITRDGKTVLEKELEIVDDLELSFTSRDTGSVGSRKDVGGAERHRDLRRSAAGDRHRSPSGVDPPDELDAQDVVAAGRYVREAEASRAVRERRVHGHAGGRVRENGARTGDLVPLLVDDEPQDLAVVGDGDRGGDGLIAERQAAEKPGDTQHGNQVRSKHVEILLGW